MKNVSKSVQPQNPVPIHQAKDENEEYNWKNTFLAMSNFEFIF
ncbi:MAG TPA: hypothetical protein PKI04_07330 [Kaistella sp.]|nr:hypothetical protein [Kaistella sp.]